MSAGTGTEPAFQAIKLGDRFFATGVYRNFSIIAHVDHGKSTLADQILLQTKAISERDFQNQILDDMEIERERGITIKARAVAINYELDGQEYELNLIDTPGHVDFNYEVTRSLAACEGALLLVDATQGVQAQTVANAHLALEGNLEIIPCVNKVDMQAARTDEVVEEIENTFGFTQAECHPCSGKTGIGVDKILRSIVEKIPAPKCDPEGTLRALIFDSVYDSYRGVVVYCRLLDGSIVKGQRILMMSTKAVFEVTELGQFRPNRVAVNTLSAGQVGYLIGNIKNLKDVHVGDTITSPENPTKNPLPGYKEPKPMVYCGCSRRITRALKICAKHSRSCHSTIAVSPMSRKSTKDWVRVSAAGSSVCSIWRSSPSGLNAKATSIWCRRLERDV